MMWNARFFCHDTPLVRRHRAGDQGGRLHPDRGIARKRLGDTRAGAVRRAPAGPQARAAPGTALEQGGVRQEAAIAIRNPELYALHYDFEVLHALLQQLPDDSGHAVQLRRALAKAGDLLRDFTKEEAVAARAVLRPELVRRNNAAPLTVWAVGHAHMDLAWLWPIRETIRKCGRTFATALAMLQRYPDYFF